MHILLRTQREKDAADAGANLILARDSWNIVLHCFSMKCRISWQHIEPHGLWGRKRSGSWGTFSSPERRKMYDYCISSSSSAAEALPQLMLCEPVNSSGELFSSPLWAMDACYERTCTWTRQTRIFTRKHFISKNNFLSLSFKSQNLTLFPSPRFRTLLIICCIAVLALCEVSEVKETD